MRPRRAPAEGRPVAVLEKPWSITARLLVAALHKSIAAFGETMSERLLSPLFYVIVLVALMLLTILTVGLSFVPSTGLMRILAGQAIAVVKASLVALFFMHALHSAAQTRAVIVVTIFWLVAIFLALTFSDYLTRGLIPNMPGH